MEPSGPVFVRFFGPVIDALKELGGSARPAEVCEVIVRELGISEEDQAETLKSGSARFNNKVAWARFYLAKAGYLDSSRRGVWTLSEKGRALEKLEHEEAMEIFRSVQSEFGRTGAKRRDEEESEEVSPPDDDGDSGVDGHRQKLLEILRDLSPAGFERFSQRLLRESGFQEVTVTGKSGDGGIDGIGVLQVNTLVSFKVLFQCKKYSGTVTPSQVRDFRGAMIGRADKGIILTTGSFTSEAKREAVRDGVPPIELVDGEKLVGMLEELELGLTPVRAFRVDRAFFDDFR